jgi:phosphoribosylformylglycinamidine (FGAM) synthase PurS component
VRINRLYELGGAFNLTHVQTAVRELLCDCVTQEFRIGAAAAASPNGGGLWRAEIWLKRGRTDAVGENLGRAMRELGIPEPITVRCGLVYHISGKLGRAQVEKAVARALANPVTQDFILSEGH